MQNPSAESRAQQQGDCQNRHQQYHIREMCMRDKSSTACDELVQHLQAAKGAKRFGRGGYNCAIFADNHMLNDQEGYEGGKP